MSKAIKTPDHDDIRQWVEDRDGRSSAVRTDSDGGILRIDFQESEPDLEELSWDEFFEIFEENNLAFLHQEETGDKQSRFNKFVDRDG